MTKATFTGLLGSLLGAVLAALPARAAESPPQAYAVLVGVGDYADKQIKPRPHAEADAKALYDLLSSKDYLGLDAQHVRLLLGTADSRRPSELATHDNIIKALHWAASKARRDDLVLFAFYGEGAPLNERCCYLASDSTFKDRAKNAVASADIEKALEKMQSQRFCVFLDADFKGFDTGKETAPDLNLQNFYQMKEYLGSEDQSAPIGRVVFLATRGVNPSLELPDHDLFTTALLDGLKGGADKEGYEPDGLVTVDELVEYLDKKVPALAREHGKTKEEKEQLHVVLEDESSHFVLTHNPAVTPTVKERLEKLEKLAADEKLSKPLAEEGRNLLTRMPKLESYRNLRKKYEALVDGKLGVEEFRKERSDLLDSLKLKRSAALDFAAKIIQGTQIISAEYVKDVNQGELVAWGIKGLYQRIEEKVPQDVKDELDKAKDMKESALTQLLADVRQRLGKREDLDNHKDIDYTLQRMLSHLDPYTTYIDPETLKRFEQDTSLRFTGIGIQIRKDTARDMLMVVTPIKGSPAYKAGLKAGDIITTITRDVDSDGAPLDKPEVLTTKGLLLQDAVKKILGKPGTRVKLTVEREGEAKPIQVEITRGMVEVESVLGVKRKANDNWDYVLDPESRICYIRITSFADNTATDLARVLRDLSRQGGIKGLILDLRFNPGGLLTSAVEISDMFIDDGLIVTIRNRAGREAAYTGESEGSLLNFPMVCLINGGSASGSEIVAACLQDHHRALLIGERSYGKGSVQNLQKFEGGKLKLTTASYWRPSGKNIHRFPNAKETDEWGVMPDKVMKLSRKEREDLVEAQHNQEIIPRRDLPPKEEVKSDFKDRQLEAAVEYLKGEIRTASRAAAKKAG